MSKKFFFGLLIVVLFVLPLLTGCRTETTSTTWDESGEPDYGGTIYLSTSNVGNLEENMDPYNWTNSAAGWFDYLFCIDWTLDRNIFAFQTNWIPTEYIAGSLAESWEWLDTQTMIIHLREGVYWHDKPPVNGREFTAYDVEYHFDRMLGTGSGFTEPSPQYSRRTEVFEKFEATAKYTVVAHFKAPTPFNNMANIFDAQCFKMSDAKEWVEQDDTQNWRNVVGTGPFLLTDFISGNSMTLSRNPEYWGRDERYPQNQLPYADTIKIICIPDISTTVAALRTGKIECLLQLDPVHAETLAETNPELLMSEVPSWSNTLNFRMDMKPFSDIRVRKALQMAVDRATIAESLYGTDEKTCGIVPAEYKDYTFLYDDWPADLKAEYSYNPDKARELLAEAAQDGVFEVNDLRGFDTNVVTPNTADIDLLKAYKSYFHDIGVEMEIIVKDRAGAESFIFDRKHDAMSVGGSGAPPTRAIQDASERSPYFCISDPNYQALLNKFNNAKDLDETKQYSTEAVKYVLEQHWHLGQVATKQYNVWQPYLKGYSGESGSFMYGIRGWLWARLWIDQDLKASMGR